MQHDIITALLSSYQSLALWLVAFMALFPILARWMPCNPGQPWWRKDTLTDIAYFFVMPILMRIARILFIGVGVYFIFHGAQEQTIVEYLKQGYGPLSELPIWLQSAMVFILSDFLLYWLHRWFHTVKMWRFHAIHHSAEHVDWLTTYRFHPINSWLSFTLVDSMMLLAGFSPEAVGLMGVFNLMYSAMVHANLNWTFGPFKYILVSPVFHRWHHTAQEEGLDKNFAPTFPLLDLLFGTFYMPEGRVPERYGVPGSDIPPSFIGQMAWPFKKQP